MCDYIGLGSAPYMEDCVQVSDKHSYYDEMIQECRRYKKQLEEMFPIPEGVNAKFTIKTFPHDFGTYAEVCIIFDDEDERACDFAFSVEANLPPHWAE